MLIRRGWFFSIFLCAAITAQRSKMSSARLEFVLFSFQNPTQKIRRTESSEQPRLLRAFASDA
jgi:hypothetical protein